MWGEDILSTGILQAACACEAFPRLHWLQCSQQTVCMHGIHSVDFELDTIWIAFGAGQISAA